MEGNLPTGHKTTVRTGLPQATWRLLNQGVPNAKSTTSQIVDTCGNLETYAVIDKDIADLNGNTLEFRLSETKAFLEGMSQRVTATIIYSNRTIRVWKDVESIIDRKDDIVVSWLAKYAPDYHNDVVFMQLQTSTGLDVNDSNLRAEYAATKWLEVNRSDYREVVANVLDDLKKEVIANRNVILGDATA